MKIYDDTLDGKILGKPLIYEYDIDYDIDGIQITLYTVTNIHGHDPGLTTDEQDEVADYLNEYEQDLYMFEHTGIKTGHLKNEPSTERMGHRD